MSPGANRILPAQGQGPWNEPTGGGGQTADPPSSLAWLRRILPWAMLLTLLAGLGGGVRLAISLGQPFPGFAPMWRKELKLFVVSNVTPPYWPGIAAGLRVNDYIQ